MEITDERLSALRNSLGDFISPKRLRHILAVEVMADRLGGLFMPEKRMKLRAAALLHDITKEYSYDRQLSVGEALGIVFSDIEKAAPKTLHAITAAASIPVRYPEFADDEIISGVRFHTTGRAGMTMFEKIIYFADYIDESRTFPDCVRLRGMFWDPDPASMTPTELDEHFTDVLIESYDVTVRGLIDDVLPIHPATSEARNELILSKKEYEKASIRR